MKNLIILKGKSLVICMISIISTISLIAQNPFPDYDCEEECTNTYNRPATPTFSGPLIPNCAGSDECGVDYSWVNSPNPPYTAIWTEDDAICGDSKCTSPCESPYWYQEGVQCVVDSGTYQDEAKWECTGESDCNDCEDSFYQASSGNFTASFDWKDMDTMWTNRYWDLCECIIA